MLTDLAISICIFGLEKAVLFWRRSCGTHMRSCFSLALRGGYCACFQRRVSGITLTLFIVDSLAVVIFQIFPRFWREYFDFDPTHQPLLTLSLLICLPVFGRFSFWLVHPTAAVVTFLQFTTTFLLLFKLFRGDFDFLDGGRCRRGLMLLFRLTTSYPYFELFNTFAVLLRFWVSLVGMRWVRVRGCGMRFWGVEPAIVEVKVDRIQAVKE